jgi:hypothetical protein
MCGFPGPYGQDITVSRSVSGFCMNRAIYSQVTPKKYSKYRIVNAPLKAIEGLVKGVALVVLAILSLVEAGVRLGIGLSVLPLSIVLILPCFEKKLFAASISFGIDRIADFFGNLTMICRARSYNTHNIF